jgi:hypothetical protein
MLSHEVFRTVQVSFLQLLMASLFFDLARRRPHVAGLEAKIYAGCALAFAVAMLPKALGAPADVSQKFYWTVCEFTDIAFLTLGAFVIWPSVSREALAFNAIGTSLAMLGLIAVADSFLQLAFYLLDFCSVSILGLAVAGADYGKNPKAASCLTIATAIYATLQLDVPGMPVKGTPSSLALISAASLTFSLCLLVVMYGRTELPYARMVRHQ